MSEQGGPIVPSAAKSGAREFVLDTDALREHIREIVGSAAFKGSRRGQQFLQHVVEKVIGGHSDELKERNLGVDLFGRSPSYDTGEDAIVRVTASDVRKRLHQFYAESGVKPSLRIDLPAGSYIPEFLDAGGATPAALLAPADAGMAPISPLPPEAPAKPGKRWLTRFRLAFCVLAVTVAGASAWLVLQRESSNRLAPQSVLPWSVLLRRDRPIQIILADPDISTIQELLGFHISLSDYANRRYVPESVPADAEIRRALHSLHGVDVPFVDVGIALRISELAQTPSQRMTIHSARSLQLDNFRTDDNFVILGSPRSNPWSALFEEPLDFAFAYDEQLKQEIIRNKRPRNNELAAYVPTAKGFETGQAFAIIGFVGNPRQTGKVLLLAGTNAEATDAAGRLVVSLDSLSRTLKQYGIDPRDTGCSFELLLEVRTLAGSPKTFEVIGCHRLLTGPA